MQARKPIVIVDMDEWLGPHGESNVSFNLGEDMKLYVDIEYDDPVDDLPRRRRLVYKGVHSLNVSGVPGVNVLNLVCSKGASPSGRVVEYLDSEAAQKWTDYLDRVSGAKIRHFLTYFMHANLSLTVLAVDCWLEQ